MLRRLMLAVVASVMFGASMCFGVPQAAAAGPCDEIIVDAAQKFGAGYSDVEVAAKSLAGVGADVRVRTITSLGRFSTLDAYVASEQSECGSWRNPGANDRDFRKNFKSNFLVFAMSVNDRTVGIFYGGDWGPAFRSSGGEGRIYDNHMGPRFRANDFSGGFVAGMNESLRVINNYLRPSSNAGSNAPASPPVVVDEEAADLTGLWWVLGILAVTGGIAILAFVGIRVARDRREAREARQRAEEERQKMRHRAISARDAASELLRPLGDLSQEAVRKARVTQYSAVSQELASELQAALAEVNTNYELATNGMAAAASSIGNADDENLMTGVYEQLAGSYGRVLEQARAADRADRRISELAQQVQAQLQRVSQDIAATQARIDQVNGALQSLKDAGITVDTIEDHLVQAQAALQEAQDNSSDLSALQHLDQAAGALEQGEAALAALNQKREQLAQGIPALETRIADVVDNVDEAHASFTRISGTYAKSTWENIKGNGTEAQKRIKAAQQVLASVRGQAEQQQWEQAIASLQEGNLLVDEALSLLHSITERERNLEVAKQTAQQEIDTAQADIDRAEQFCEGYDDDIARNWPDDIRQAREILDQARAELAKPKPDYLKVRKLALDANASADHIYAAAAEEHEAAERTRHQAESTLTRATTATSKAEEFISDHRSDVGSSAESDLSSAKQSLQRARNSGNAADKLRHATDALEEAESAYSKAYDDFQSAENAREAERRRRREREEAERRERERNNPVIVVTNNNDNDFGGGWGRSGGIDFGGGGSSGSFDFGGGGGGSSGSFDGGGGGGSSGGW